MKRGVLLLMLVCFLFPLMASAAQNPADDLIGKWLTKDDESVVEIYKCDGSYCLKIVWLEEPLNHDGTEKCDTNNPDDSKHKDKIIGLTIGAGFNYKDGDGWRDGSIYDPDSGKTYSCKMNITDKGLKVRGFIGVSLFGRTEIWKRKN